MKKHEYEPESPPAVLLMPPSPSLKPPAQITGHSPVESRISFWIIVAKNPSFLIFLWHSSGSKISTFANFIRSERPRPDSL